MDIGLEVTKKLGHGGYANVWLASVVNCARLAKSFSHRQLFKSDAMTQVAHTTPLAQCMDHNSCIVKENERESIVTSYHSSIAQYSSIPHVNTERYMVVAGGD